MGQVFLYFQKFPKFRFRLTLRFTFSMFLPSLLHSHALLSHYRTQMVVEQGVKYEDRQAVL